MHSTPLLLAALLPLLGVEAKSYRGSNRGGSGSGQSALGNSLAASKLQSTGDTATGTQCSNGGNTNNAGGSPGCNDCGVSTFSELYISENQAPLVEDCNALIASIQADQEWTITHENRNIVSSGTCAFQATAPNGGQANIGNADVIDLVTDSIKNFAKNGRVSCQGGYSQTVSSTGTMSCDNAEVPGAQQVQINWFVTSSGQQSGSGSGSGGNGFSNWFPGTVGQGGESNGGNDWDILNTNQNKGGSSPQGGSNEFDISHFQNSGNGNGGQIQRRDGKTYKVVKF